MVNSFENNYLLFMLFNVYSKYFILNQFQNRSIPNNNFIKKEIEVI